MAKDTAPPENLQPLSTEEVEALIDACRELRCAGEGALPFWSSNLLLCALLTVQAREAELQALQWRPIQTAPDEGRFLIARRAPEAERLAVQQLELPPACPAEQRDRALQAAEAWAPLPEPPRA